MRKWLAEWVNVLHAVFGCEYAECSVVKRRREAKRAS